MRNAGITMVETIILVAVIGILMGMTTPTVNRYIDRRQAELEQTDMLEIQNAMTEFAKVYNRLPDINPISNAYCNTPNNTWNECLALFSVLSAEQIATDVWDRPRTYLNLRGTETLSILPEGLEIHYATVHSSGVNQVAENLDEQKNILAGIALNGNDFAVPTNNNWWINGGTVPNSINIFEGVRAGGDDQLIKFSDLAIKLEKFKETRLRLRQIATALTAYASSKKQQQTVLNNPDRDRLVYFPRGLEVQQSQTQLTSIDPTVTADVQIYNSGNSFIENQDSTVIERQTRLTSMVALMRLLGLPDEYCCDALVKDGTINGDFTQERPFFYYMNPRDRRAGVCLPRPDEPPFLPARVSRNPSVCE
ncbi:MAG: hypothetical protein OXR68_03750 [Alphaproteobacteria bacterium]|nr:hypothetical protein [Alphaproteobacteria bacterium]MDD9919721.1 hypothetical protein [Alphaproteobacteria bacterium]